MQRLCKTDPCATCHFDEQTGQHILCGAGELHLEVCINALRELAGIELRATDPVVQYFEAVQVEGRVCLAKSSNKHNRIYVRASPLTEALVRDLAEGRITATQEAATRVAQLADVHDWPRDRARRIMAMAGTCVMVDGTQGVSTVEVRDNIVAAFNELVSAGPLAGEELRGVCFELVDVKYHADAAHRRGDQISPAVKRACFAAVMTAEPCLQEPVFAVEIACPDAALAPVCRALKKRQGEIVDDIISEGTPLHTVKAFLPVASSFGFSTELRSESSGRAFPQCSFSHWQRLADDPLRTGSRAACVVASVRTRKGMSAAVPPLDSFLDTL